MTLFERTKEIAKNRKISLLALNDQAGLGTNAIYKWKGTNPSLAAVQKVAKVLNVSTDYLLGNTDEIIPNKTSITSKPVDNSIEGIKERLVSYDGVPVTDHDAKVIKQFLDAYYSNKDGEQ